MNDGDSRNSHVDEVMDCARAVETAIQQLCRASGSRPRMTPADVSAVLADLAAATAALPQVASQLGDILQRATDDYLLKMDATADGGDPARAVETARLHLGAIRGPALDINRLLDAAHNETAHLAAIDRPPRLGWRDVNDTSRVHRPEERRPPPAGSGGIWPAPPR
jgi:predicted RNA-binding Zn ribbon-like protein